MARRFVTGMALGLLPLMLGGCELRREFRFRDAGSPFEGPSDVQQPTPPTIVIPPPRCNVDDPSITERTPARDAVNVPVDAAIVVSFSETLRWGDITAGMRLRPRDGGAFVDLDCDPGDHSYRCQPRTALKPDTRYEVAIDGCAFYFGCTKYLQLGAEELSWTFTSERTQADADSGTDDSAEDAGADDAGTDDDAGPIFGRFDCFF